VDTCRRTLFGKPTSHFSTQDYHSFFFQDRSFPNSTLSGLVMIASDYYSMRSALKGTRRPSSCDNRDSVFVSCGGLCADNVDLDSGHCSVNTRRDSKHNSVGRRHHTQQDPKPPKIRMRPPLPRVWNAPSSFDNMPSRYETFNYRPRLAFDELRRVQRPRVLPRSLFS
jgi:hypothetical protein